jgi:hypothetical protein
MPSNHITAKHNSILDLMCSDNSMRDEFYRVY